MPGVKVGVGYIDIKPDMKGFGRELQTGMTRNVKSTGDKAAKTLTDSFSGAAKKAAGAFGIAFAAVQIKDFIGGAITAASDLAESTSKAGIVFDDAAGKVKTFAETAATAIGQSKQQALEATGTFGNLFVSMGLGTGTAADMSIAIVKLASDLASFNNVSPDEALLALRSGLVGETEPLRRFGVNLNDATLKAKALELGLIRTTKDALDPAAKAQAAYALIFEQSVTAQGDFARTSDGLANQQRTMTAQWTDAKAALGEGLLPVMVEVAGVLNDTLIPALQTLFLGSGADATGWAATLRDAIGDTVGFALGAFAELARAIANVVGAIPGNIGEGVIQNLRDVADGIDGARTKLHASTGELLSWQGAADGAGSSASALTGDIKQLAGATKDATSATRAHDKATRDAADADRDLKSAQRDLAELLRQGAVDEEKVADARERLGSATRSLNKANRELANAQEEYNDAQAAYLALPTDTNADALRDASDNLADAKDGVAEATDRQKDAEGDLADAQAGDPDFANKLADAYDRVADAKDKVADTNDKVVELTTNTKAATAAVVALNGELAKVVLPWNFIGPLAPGQERAPAPLVGAGPLQEGQTRYVPPLAGAGPLLPGQERVAPTTTTTNNITVNVTEPVQDPGLIGKAIAWVL